MTIPSIKTNSLAKNLGRKINHFKSSQKQTGIQEKSSSLFPCLAS